MQLSLLNYERNVPSDSPLNLLRGGPGGNATSALVSPKSTAPVGAARVNREKERIHVNGMLDWVMRKGSAHGYVSAGAVRRPENPNDCFDSTQTSFRSAGGESEALADGSVTRPKQAGFADFLGCGEGVERADRGAGL